MLTKKIQKTSCNHLDVWNRNIFATQDVYPVVWVGTGCLPWSHQWVYLKMGTFPGQMLKLNSQTLGPWFWRNQQGTRATSKSVLLVQLEFVAPWPSRHGHLIHHHYHLRCWRRHQCCWEWSMEILHHLQNSPKQPTERGIPCWCLE